MTDGERFVRGLAAALPEAFAGLDVAQEYDHTLQTTPGGEPWATTIALADAVHWIEDTALEVDRRAQTVTLPAAGPDQLRRFFAYIEQVLADPPCHDTTGWIAVELFEGVPWTEDVLDYLGPRTKLLLADAQRTLAAGNRWIGRWSDSGA